MPPALHNPFVLWFVLTLALAVACYFGMRRELRVRAVLYGSFLIACVVAFWPPYGKDDQPGKIKLGLDLKGGIHLVLQVVTDDALNATIDDAVQTARDQATRKGIVFASAQRVDATSFAVEGVEPARVKDMRDLLRDFFRAPDWDMREPAEGRFVVKMTDSYVRQIKDRTVKEAIKTLERRVNQLGVADPVITEHGSRGDQILVQLPGVTDVEQAKRVIKTTAQLALKIVEDQANSREALLQAHGGKVPENGRITGRYTAQEADELAKVLRAGALPATLKYLQELTVGASLGRDSIRAGVRAALMGMAFLAIFMLAYYRLSGLNAIVALTANLVILLGAMAYTGATLTLPGIAGVILTIGVGVDTNVLIFERIREELRNGKTIRAAINNGFERVWITILDTHATALIAAAFLFQFGTGPVKGFAVTLVMGLIANIFASYFVSRFLFEWVLGRRQAATLSI